MARTRNPGLLHSLPALLIGVTMLVVGIGFLTELDPSAFTAPARFARASAPGWLMIAIVMAVGAAVTVFGILSVRQTWREVRNRPARQQWLGY